MRSVLSPSTHSPTSERWTELAAGSWYVVAATRFESTLVHPATRVGHGVDWGGHVHPTFLRSLFIPKQKLYK